MTRPGSTHTASCNCGDCINTNGVIQIVVPGTGGGVQGTQGIQGRQGVQGPTGTQGPQGVQGTQGISGAYAAQGVQGPVGPQGPTGSGTQGVQGPQGTSGTQGIAGTGVNSTDDVPEGVNNLYFTVNRVSYIYTQDVASSSWVITHNLGFYPNIVVKDSANSVVEGEIDYDSANQVTLTFQSAFSGMAYLS